jgi:flagellar biosynthesis protein FliR
MTTIGSDAVLTAFVLFCRIGGCLMLMLGYSSQRVALNVRLFIAFSVTLALTPILSSEIETHLSGIAPAALTIGLTSVLAGPIEENEPLPAIATLITLTATALIFFTDLHWEVLRGLVASYSALPVSGLFDARFDLVQVSDCLTKSFLVSLRISSPFIVYALIINLAIGLAGKLAPQIPHYFITVPAIIAGGLLLFCAICEPFMQIFNAAFSTWIPEG